MEKRKKLNEQVSFQDIKKEVQDYIGTLLTKYPATQIKQILKELMSELPVAEIDYGFHHSEIGDSLVIYDKFGNNWFLDDWVNDLVDPYWSEDDAIVDFVEGALHETGVDKQLKQQGIDVYDYATRFTKFAQWVYPDYVMGTT